LSEQHTPKSKSIDYFQVPAERWRLIEPCLPQAPERHGAGRPCANQRAIWNGIWYHLWSGCQWKAIHRTWFGVWSSVIHARFQNWQQRGVFDTILRTVVEFYAERQGIGWSWQSVDRKMSAAPLADDACGRNPTDRGKQGSKIHLLVDERGAPLALHVTAAHEHDKWSADDLIMAIVVERPTPAEGEQHFCADKGYDYEDVHAAVDAAHYTPHIKHRRRRNEPHVAACPAPGQLAYPARRWVVERTFAWLNKRRAIRIRCTKKACNCFALLLFACAHILLDMAIFGLTLNLG
jgi:putative transposase